MPKERWVQGPGGWERLDFPDDMDDAEIARVMGRQFGTSFAVRNPEMTNLAVALRRAPETVPREGAAEAFGLNVPAPRMGRGEAFDASLEAGAILHTPGGRSRYRQGQQFERLDDAENAAGQVIPRSREMRGGLEYFNPALGEFVDVSDYRGERAMREAPEMRLSDYSRGGISTQDMETRIEAARARDPQAMANVPTAEGFEQQVDTGLREIAEREGQAFRDRPLTSIGGGVAASFGDPINLATGFIPVGRGFGFLGRLGSAGGMNAAVEAVEQPLLAAEARQVGGPQITGGEMAANIGMAGAFGVGFQGAGEGLGAGARAFARSRPAREAPAPADASPLTREPAAPDARPEPSVRPAPRDPWENVFPGDRPAWAKLPRGADEPLDDPLDPRTWTDDEPVAPRQDPPRDVTDDALDMIRRGERPKADLGLSLIDFLAQNGGLRDVNGELRNVGLDAWHRERPFRRKLIRDEGMSLEDAALRAQEAGYLPARVSRTEDTRPMEQDLIDAMGREFTGKPIYAADRLSDDAVIKAQDMEALIDDLEFFLTQAGIDPSKATNIEIRDALAAHVWGTGAGDIPLAPGIDPAVYAMRKTPPESERVNLANGPADQSLIPGVAPISETRRQIDAELLRRLRRRGVAKPPENGLFGSGQRTELTGDLFGSGDKPEPAVSSPREQRIEPADGSPPDGGGTGQPPRGTGGGSGSAGDRGFFDEYHAELYDIGKAALEGREVDPRQALSAWQRMAPYIDLKTLINSDPEFPTVPLAKRERQMLHQGRFTPERAVEIAKLYARETDDLRGVGEYNRDLIDGDGPPQPVNNWARSWYDPDELSRYIEDRTRARGNAPDRPPPPGGKSAMFAGPRARTADNNALARAEAMDASGMDAEAIRKTTGWHRGDDGDWRFEISDLESRLKEPKPGAKPTRRGVGAARLQRINQTGGVAWLDEVFDHPELFKAYPHLKDVKVRTNRDVEYAASGEGPDGVAIYLNPALANKPGEARSAILHEIQHAIQNKEGWALGTVPGADYLRSAGEIEARNTQRRRDLSAEDRAGLSPEATRDTPRADAVVDREGVSGAPDKLAMGAIISPTDVTGVRMAPRPGDTPVADDGKVGRAAYAGERVQEMQRKLKTMLGVPVRKGRMTTRGKGALGEYDPKTGVARTKSVADYNVVTHEIGHGVDTRAGPNVRAAIDRADELAAMAYETAAPEVRHKEGFAEFFRHYMTNPVYARRQAPKFYDDFEAALAKDKPDVAKGLIELQAAYQEYISAPSSGAVAANVVSVKPRNLVSRYAEVAKYEGAGGMVQKVADDAYMAYADRFHPLNIAVRQLKRTAKENKVDIGDLRTTENPYRMARMASGSYASALMDIKEGVRPHKGLDPDGPALQEALRMALGRRWKERDFEDFSAYLISRRMRHEWERFDNGELQRPPDMLSRDSHEATVAQYDAAHPEWAEAAQMVTDWTNQLWRKRFEAGLISEESYLNGLAKPDYVPAHRDMTDTDATGSKGRKSGKFAGGANQFKGSDRPFLNPIQTLMREAFELNQIIARNEVLKTLDALARRAGPGGGAIAERIPATELAPEHVNIADATLAKARELGLDDRDHEVMLAEIQARFGDDLTATVFKNIDAPERGEPIVYLWEGGQRVPIRLPDGEFGRDMFKIVSGMTEDQRSMLLDIGTAFSHAFRFGITTHPAFTIRNFIRDQLSAWLLTDVGFKPGASGLSGIADEVLGRDVAKRYSHLGGLMGGANVAALGQARKLSPQALGQKPSAGDLPARGVGLARGIAKMSEISETGTRLAVFKLAFAKAKKQGMDDYDAAMEAVFEARDYFDTDLHGSRMLAAKRLFPFFNASVQSVRKAINVGTAQGRADEMVKRALRPLMRNKPPETPGEKAAAAKALRLWVLMTAVGVLGAGVTSIYRNDPEYHEFDDRERATYWIVKGPDGKWLKIAKPFELAAVSNIMERAVERYYEEDPTAWARMRRGLWDITVPPVTLPPATVAWEIRANRDYAGRPIVPDHLKGRVEPIDQVNSYTSELGKTLSRALGGQVSPAVMDHAVAGLFGTWGREAENLSNLARPGERAALSREDIFAANAVTIAPQRGTKSASEFWNLAASNGGKLAKAEGSLRGHIRSGDLPRAASHLAGLDPVTRDYVMSQVFSTDGSGKAHPIERARLANSVVSELRRQITTSSQIAGPNGQVIRLSPVQRRDADDALSRLQMTELHNALALAGVRGWAQREPMDLNEPIADLQAVSPALFSALNARMAEERVPTPDAAARAWPALRDQYRNVDERTLLMMLAREREAPSGGARGPNLSLPTLSMDLNL